MPEMLNVRVDSTVGSSKVIPIFDQVLTESGREQVGENMNRNNVSSETLAVEVVENSTMIGIPEDEFSGEKNPQDAWLPITESRKGNTLTAAVHLLSSGIGTQALLLPVAFVSLGWFWGILLLSLVFCWQLYTIWLLVNLHEPSPQTGIRYSRFLHLSIVAFGEKLGKWLAMFPTMYLSGGTCALYIISGGTTMELFYQAMCEDNLKCQAKSLTGAQWFLLFICLAIFIAFFVRNLNSVAPISVIGSITVIAYCSLLWILSVSKGGPDHDQVDAPILPHHNNNDSAGVFRNVLNSIGMIALAFRGHNLVLEIQGTLPTNTKQPSLKSMWRGVAISYLLIAMCLFPLAIVGYWAYGNKIPMNGGILTAFTKLHRNNTSKYMIGAVYLIIIISYLCAFQIYAMPVFDNLARLYTSRKKACPSWFRAATKLWLGGLTYFVAVTFPFLPSLGAFTGSIVLPLTLVYPCLMWVAIKKPARFSRMWCLNVGLASLGIMLSLMCATAALWSLIINGVDANFFKPR
ncbi:UNVERIFIED_CONTAM: Lysine histidine transporter-like 8 [Sesamum radiatum]|uniref:Lysine histidine transporter-like 8 n=1 Tax=Sesamum radiatum TaxID=300843 RepID=A0AAW2RVK6_SESRA